MATKKVTLDIKVIEDALVRAYNTDSFRELAMSDRRKAFGVVVNTKSGRTGLYLSQVVTDTEERSALTGAVLDRIVGKVDVGF